MLNQSVETNQRGSFNSTVQDSDVFHEVFNSPIGPLKIIASETSLKKIEFLELDSGPAFSNSTPLLKEAKNQILAFLRGDLTKFTLPFSFDSGTAFQQEVWFALEKIPLGEWMSYGELAKVIGRPKASRAIGGAANKNPLPLVIPCHRLLGASGDLVGFAPGLSYKKDLLVLEGHQINGNSIGYVAMSRHLLS